MTRKIRAILVLSLLAVGLVLWLFPSDPVRRATYDRLHFGMTEAQVVAVVGIPPNHYGHCRVGKYPIDAWEREANCGDIVGYTGDEGPGWFDIIDQDTHRVVARELEWFTKRYRLYAIFSPEGRLVVKGCASAGGPDEGAWECLKRLVVDSLP